MTELLNSSYVFSLQEPYKYLDNFNSYCVTRTWEEIRKLNEYNPCDEYLEYKSFYEQDEESSIKIIKLTKIQQLTEKHNLRKTFSQDIVRKKRNGNYVKGMSFNSQK